MGTAEVDLDHNAVPGDLVAVEFIRVFGLTKMKLLLAFEKEVKRTAPRRRERGRSVAPGRGST